jgi:outer membrane lipoprotein SlyB
MTHLRRTAARAAFLLALPLAVAACAPPQSGNLVNANQAQVAQTVSFGTVVAAQPVTVQGTNPAGDAAGTLGGAAVGVAIGNQIGGGSGRDVARVLGGVAGAAVGNRAANAATLQQSTEWTVRLDSGRSVSVIQASPTFGQGQRVQVIQGRNGLTRLAPA